MKCIIFLILNFSCFECSLILETTIERLDSDATIIPVKIVINYLNRYFDDEEVFISISSSSSNYNQKQVQDDLIHELVLNLLSANFSHNILDKVDSSRLGNKNVFNLLFTDESSSLT